MNGHKTIDPDSFSQKNLDFGSNKTQCSSQITKYFYSYKQFMNSEKAY